MRERHYVCIRSNINHLENNHETEKSSKLFFDAQPDGFGSLFRQ